jgi:peptide deformylase
MALRPILILPDPLLRKQSKPVERVDAELKRLIDDMFETMYDAPGIGLAAPQLGVSRRLIVMDPAKDDAPKTPLVMINPEILDRSEELRLHDEGCLSIPDFTAEIERPAKIRVAYIDREGKPEERELAGIWSTLVQHEIDHLNGILFIDYLSRLKRDMVVRKFSKQKRTEAL